LASWNERLTDEPERDGTWMIMINKRS